MPPGKKGDFYLFANRTFRNLLREKGGNRREICLVMSGKYLNGSILDDGGAERPLPDVGCLDRVCQLRGVLDGLLTQRVADHGAGPRLGHDQAGPRVAVALRVAGAGAWQGRGRGC